MPDAAIVGDLKGEFEGAEIGDWRLRERLMLLSQSLDAAPEASLPRAVKTTAAREAAYRFLGNSRVSLAGVIAGHVNATVQRCRNAGTVYVASDTSEFSFSGEERGKKLGRLQRKTRGFLGHFALAIDGGSSPVPLGVLGIDIVVRSDEKQPERNIYQRKKDPDRESLRWGRMVETTSAALGEVSAIHLMDSEADIFELLTELKRSGRRFIIRSAQDRLLDEGHLEEAVEHGEVLLTREVCLARRTKAATRNSRRNPPRKGRTVQLTVSALKVSLRRPKTCTAEYPSSVPINVVRVHEAAPPEGETPVEWILFTSEAIASAADVAAVVDGYRRRWLIEEYFKAVKTGCKYEARELESLRTLTNLLGIVSVIAWRLLLLRTLERDKSDRPATDVVEPVLLEALAARLIDIREPKHLPQNPTVSDLMNGIARLGGHITSNGPPGWQVLWRGYQDLLIWGGGYIRARSITYRDQS
jgi:hypothetical protein